MLLRWLKSWRRRTLRDRLFPAAWEEILLRNVAAFAELSPDEQARVRGYIQIFVAEKYWEGCGGQPMTPEVQVTIAAQVGILVLGLDDEYFERSLSILVYPEVYLAPKRTAIGGQVWVQGDTARLGETSYGGPVVLSWSGALGSGRRERAGNVVYHEFAHQLDMASGSLDGTPALETDELARRWAVVMEEHYQRLVRDCSAGAGTVLDCYGATDRAEFFAVATETFFTRSRTLQLLEPDLYDLLRDYYKQDPVGRTP